MGFRRSLVRIQSPRLLRLVVTRRYGKPVSFTFSGPGTLWARIEPETAPKSRRPATTYSLNADCRSHTVCSTRPDRAHDLRWVLKRESKVLAASDTDSAPERDSGAPSQPGREPEGVELGTYPLAQTPTDPPRPGGADNALSTNFQSLATNSTSANVTPSPIATIISNKLI